VAEAANEVRRSAQAGFDRPPNGKASIAASARPGGRSVVESAEGAGTVKIVTELASVDFGLDALNTWARGKDCGFKMNVDLRIQVEAVARQAH
jgi:hypothetical protein